MEAVRLVSLMLLLTCALATVSGPALSPPVPYKITPPTPEPRESTGSCTCDADCTNPCDACETPQCYKGTCRVKLLSGTVCRPASGTCQLDATCSGTLSTCPANPSKSNCAPPAPAPPQCSSTCGQCATCAVRLDRDPTQVVVQMGTTCGTWTAGWMTCTDSSCSVSSCGNNGGTPTACVNGASQKKCDNANRMIITVASDATTVDVQYSNSGLSGVACSGGSCCGLSSPGCASATSSVCQQEISLDDCPECLTNADCTPSEDGCELNVCVQGACQKQLQAEGYVCRQASGTCETPATCDGKSASCCANGFLGSDHPCRTSTGPCDEGESCDGSHADCPADSGNKPGCSAGGLLGQAAAEVKTKRR